jgi:AraC-like DNA-binding protein
MTGEPPVYAEFAPRAALSEFVHCVWTFTAPPDDTPQPIAPDGRPELIIHCRNPYLERGASGFVLQSPVLFAGQLTKPLILVAHGDVAVVGVRFRPDGARAFLGCGVDVATDCKLDLAVLHGEAAVALGKAVRETGQLRLAAQLSQDYVEARLAGARVDTVVREAVTGLLAGKGAREPTGVSERQYQRRFKLEVGVSPRMLRSILRFRSVFDAIEHPENMGWVKTALAAGYFDQPQMARDFRRFLGCTAREWAAQPRGLALALTQPAQTPEPMSDSYKMVEPASA